MAPRDSVTRMARRIRACPAIESLATAWCFQSANGRKWRLRCFQQVISRIATQQLPGELRSGRLCELQVGKP